MCFRVKYWKKRSEVQWLVHLKKVGSTKNSKYVIKRKTVDFFSASTHKDYTCKSASLGDAFKWSIFVIRNLNHVDLGIQNLSS